MSSNGRNNGNGNDTGNVHGSARIVVITLLFVVLIVVCFAAILKPQKKEVNAVNPAVAGEAAVTAEEDYFQTPDAKSDDFDIGAGAGKVSPSPMAPLHDETIEAGPAPAADEETAADTAAPVAEEAKSDPYDIYLVDEDWLKTYGGFCVERDGKLYALADAMPATVITTFGCGYQPGEGEISPDACTYLNLSDKKEISDVPTQARNALISVGDFPIFYVEPGEELRLYSNISMEKVSVKRAEFYGYTIPATGIDTAYYPVMNHRYNHLLRGVTSPSVLTPDGNPVEDVRQLEHGKEYMYEWYTGTEYHSKTFTADSRCYVVDDDDLAFFVPVNRTKNGYSVIDLSEVEPGNTYTIQGLPFELR